MSAIFSRGSELDSLTTAPVASMRERDLTTPIPSTSQTHIENLLRIVNELSATQLETLTPAKLKEILLTLYWQGLLDEETLLSYQGKHIDASFLQNKLITLKLDLHRRLDVSKENASMARFLKVNLAVIFALLMACGVQNAYWRDGNIINQIFNKRVLIDLDVGEPWSSAYGHVFVPTFELSEE